MVSVESPTRFSVWGLSIPHSLVRRKLEPPNESIPRWSGLVFDERSQPFGRVVPLRRDLIEVPLCSLQALAVQVPHPLTPPAGVAHEPHTPEGVEVTRNRLTRHPGPFTETSNRQRPACGQASQQAEPSRVAQRGEQRRGAPLTRHTSRAA